MPVDKPLIVEFKIEQVWSDGSAKPLMLLVYPVDEAYIFVLADSRDNFTKLNELKDLMCSDFLAAVACLDLAVFDSRYAWPLHAVDIAKPWGKEVWYTGIEQRGVSCFTSEKGDIPIPYLLNALPEWFLAGDSAPILFKTLVPLPDEVYGDLYLELHQQKQEVYVVTDIDQGAWPDGRGYIRLGFSDKEKAYDSKPDFVEAYRQSIKKYHQIRQQIDALQDEIRKQTGLTLNEPITAELQKQWNALLPEELLEQENRLRADMDSFTNLVPLSLGDVVKVPILTPHALQHGVCVAEFQTPVYERKILSFAQKVLTQANWDTDEALAMMQFDQASGEIVTLIEDEGVLLEEVVSFEEFTVQRLRLASGKSISLDCRVYSLLFCIVGEVSVNRASQPLLSSQAAYLSPQLKPTMTNADSAQGYFQNLSSQESVILIAQVTRKSF